MVRYGLIGAGTMGIEHIRNIRLTPRGRVAAIADPHPPSRAAAAAVAGEGVALFEDYRDLLAAPGIDALVIATPNHTHVAVLGDALSRGKPIMVEKPLCTTVEDCRRILEAARGGMVWVAMEYRYMPPVARLIAAARDGVAGEVRMIAIREHRNPFLRKVGDWNRFARNTGGTMVEKCCHFFDLMRLIARARPLSVYASGGQDVNHLNERYGGERPDIIDNAFAIVDFEDGRRAMLDLCMFAEASVNEQEITVTGDAGKLVCTVPDSNLVIGRRAPLSVTTEHVPVEERLMAAGAHHGSTYYEHLAFQKAVAEGAEPEVTLMDGLIAVAMGAAAERSIAEKRPVMLSEFGM